MSQPSRTPDPRSGYRWACLAGALGCLVLVGGCTGLVVLLGWQIKQAVERDFELPPELARGGAFRGAGLLREDVFYTDAALGGVLLVQRGELDPKPGLDIAVLGAERGVFLDDAGRVKARLTLPHGETFCAPVRLVHVAGQDGCAYFDQTETFRAHDGRQLWRRERGHLVRGLATGRLDGSGSDAIVVGALRGEDGSGIERLDPSGRRLWRVDSAGMNEVAIAEHAGAPCVVYSSPFGLRRLDAAGRSQGATVPLRGLFGGAQQMPRALAAVRFPTADSPSCLVTVEQRGLSASQVVVRSLDGDERFRQELPLASSYAKTEVAVVRPWRDRPAYLAVARDRFSAVGQHRGAMHILVYLYDAQGTLVYATSLRTGLQHGAPALAAVPRPDGRGERLLIGGEGKVVALSAPDGPAPAVQPPRARS